MTEQQPVPTERSQSAQYPLDPPLADAATGTDQALAADQTVPAQAVPAQPAAYWSQQYSSAPSGPDGNAVASEQPAYSPAPTWIPPVYFPGDAGSPDATAYPSATTPAGPSYPTMTAPGGPAYPVTPAPAPAAASHRPLRAVMALVLAGAGVGLGVGIGRATDGGSLATSLGDQTTTQADPGTTASGTSGSTGSGSTASGSTGSGSTGSGSTGSGSTGTGTGTGGTGTGGTGTGGTGTGTGTGGTGNGSGTGIPSGPGWGWGSGQRGGGATTGTTTDVSTPATAAQQVGIVDINTTLKYQSASAAGTGMVLTSSGEILTNNHVVNGATAIKVTVVSTGKTYTATVVGTDASDDIAVLKLVGASGLATAKLADTAKVAVGDKVTGVGNAGGVGGTPSAASGKVTAVNQTITAADEGGTNAEKLTGLIETDANVLAGDSGGPLYNNSGSVIGINTAGASTNAYSDQDQSYAIPISTALTIAKKITNGEASIKIHIGSQAFLGISVATGQTSAVKGATVSDVVAAGPAAKAGLVAGDVITSIGGQAVTSATSLSTAMDKHHGGDKLVVKWVTAAGKAKQATITTIEGPAK